MSTLRKEILEHNLVRNVAVHLKTSQESPMGRELVKNVLRALIVIAKRCTAMCTEQISEGSSKFKHLLPLADDSELRDSVIIMVLILCHIERYRPELGNAGCVEMLLKILMDPNISYTDVLYQNGFSALCFLTRESVNRAKIRRAGGLAVFMSALQRGTESTANIQRSQALHSLVQFTYDDLGMAELLHAGLFGALSTHLAAAVKNFRHKTCTYLYNRKRIRYSSPSYTVIKKDLNRSFSSDSIDSSDQQIQGDWSPASTSGICYSPGGNSSPSPSSTCSSPPPTPREYDWPDLYSPVTAEYNDEESGIEESWKDLVEESESEDSPDTDIELPDMPIIGSSNDSGYILILLSRISNMESSLHGLALAPTLETLIDYIVQIESEQQCASKILARIIRNRKFFLRLVKEGFVLSVHGRCMQPIHRDCEKCAGVEAFGMTILRQLSVQAESSFGTGEMEHVLHRGEPEIRTSLALSIPHIIKNTTKLRKLLLGCNGLDIILSTLCGKDLEKYLKQSPHSLHSLSLSLRVKNPADKRHFREATIDTSRTFSQTTEKPSGNSVTILLDCGTKVYADREMLCRCSPFFSAMMSESGKWREAGKTEVELHDVDAKPLQLMLSVAASGHRTESLCKKAGIGDVLSTITLLDRFLFDCVDTICALVLQWYLSPSSVAYVFLEAAQCGQPELMTCIRLGALRYLLVAKMLAAERQQAFKMLLQSSKRDIFLSDLSRLLRSELTC